MRKYPSPVVLGSVMAAGLIAGAAALQLRHRRGQAARRTICADPALHARKVERIARQLRERRSTRPLVLHKRAVSHMVPKAHDRRHSDDQLDIRDLNAILAVDPVRRICVAEPGVTFVDLVATTLRYGLVPTTVPELKTITIGGAVAGCSIESMSFRHGGFHDACLAYEVISATGEVLTCTPDGPDALLFQMMHGTFGTLGILSQLTFKLVPARRFVHVIYERHATLDSYLDAMRGHQQRDDLDFMDGILHAPDQLVLSVGHFVDDAPYTHRYDRPGAAYYRTTATRADDYLRTEDYFFRYDRGVTNVNPVLASSRVLRLGQWLHRLLDDDRPNLTLDVFVPLSRVPRFLDWYRREIGAFPIWAVPYRRHDYPWLVPGFFDGIDDELFLDLAFYGVPQAAGRNYYRMIEEELEAIGGLKTLISHNYYPEDEFWRTWNKTTYDQVKQRTDPDNLFRGLYEKTHTAARGLS